MSDKQNKTTPATEESVSPVIDEATEPVVSAAPNNNDDGNKKTVKEKKTTGKESFSRARAIVGVALIVAAIVVAILLIPLMSGKDVSYTVLYAKQDVPAGVHITNENIGQYFEAHTTPDASLYSAGIPADKARDVIGGSYTKRDIYAGKMATKDDFSKTNIIYSDKVPEGKLLIAIDIPSLEGNVGYMPKAGDIIKIYHMVEYKYDNTDIYFDAANIHVPIGNTGSGSYATPYDYLQYVQIYAAIDGDLNDADANNTAEAAFVLLVNDGVQAQQVVEAANSGNYYFALVSSGDKARAEAFLKLQDQIIEEGIAGAGREEHVFKLSDLTPKEYIPEVNDTVRFSAAVAHDGITSVENPRTLKYVTVLDVYDADGVSLGLLDEIPEDILETGSIGLNLTEEQAELIQKYIDDGQVFMTKVEETQDKIISGFDAVNEYLWSDRAQNILQNETTPEGAAAAAKKDAE